MNTVELTSVLEECLQLAEKEKPTLDKENFRLTRGFLSEDLRSLLLDAVEMKWPFVEERWQYKHSVTSEDKVNTMDLINHHLPQLMAFLKACISAVEPHWAMSAVFLLDRFLYWIDSSHILLKIAKALHRRYPETSVAPQIVIRQARIYLNTGKLQKAEYILSSLINTCGATGCWKYHKESDRTLVQAVSFQVRGQVLQKLGLWLEAAELIWASLIGFYILPLPDKKGIGTSLGLLASVLISMNDKDFTTFKKKPLIDLGFLGNCSNRLLCAAQAARMAVVYSQFGSLYVLTHMVTQGTCLLSYSFSRDCPAAEKQLYLSLAKEAFENGLLTKTEKDVVTSQQELHTLIKAAYCLAITNKWMCGPVEEISLTIKACQEANALLYSYCYTDDLDKTVVSSEVMAKVQRAKSLLKVKSLVNSDPCSFMPDSYKTMEDKPVPFTPGDFTKMIENFQKHHQSVCEAFKASELKVRRSRLHANCITAFQTTLTGTLTTECDANILDLNKSEKSADPSIRVFHKETLGMTLESEDDQPSKNGQNPTNFEIQRPRRSQGSSSLGSSGESFELVDPSLCTEAEESQAKSVQNNQNGHKWNDQTSVPASTLSAGALVKEGNAQNQPEQDLCTTLESIEDDKIPNNSMRNGENTRTSSGSFSSCLGSSWQSISFSSSPQNDDLAKILKDKSVIDQICETVSSEDGPDSPFELISLNCATPISKGGQTASFQTSDVIKCQIKDESSIETAEDIEDAEVSLLRDGISGFAIADGHANGINANNATAKPQEVRPDQTYSGNGQRNSSSVSNDSYEMVQLDESEPKRSLELSALAHKAIHKNPADSQKKNILKVVPLLETETDDCKPCSLSSKPVENLRKKDDSQCPSDYGFDQITCINYCKGCFQGCVMGSEVLKEHDYKSLFSGVCQSCLLKRLPDKTFKLRQYNKVYSALVVKYSKATHTWTGCETSVYVGELLQVDVIGAQRQAFRIQYLHQEQLLGSYVGKEYLKEMKPYAHLADVERQMTAQYYIMEFNKRLYESNITTQIFYIPSELLLITEDDCIVACVSVEPFMLGDFVKLTNNTTKTDHRYSATEYGIAFGHFTYEFSNKEEVVVDLQGWVTANGKGLAYLTDPQIHSLRKPRSSSNFHQNGINKFMLQQHGERCNPICLAALNTFTHLTQ